HARSLDSAHHPSRAWVKQLQARIGAAIPAGWRVCGENLFARHSIAYENLQSWFYGFSVWAGDRCLDWDATVRFLRRIGVPAPPVLWRGTFDARALRNLRVDTVYREGYVVRTVEGFPREEFAQRVAKWVRPQHVQTDTHWMYAAVVANGLGPDAPLWAVRSGADIDAQALLTALSLAEDAEDAGDAGAHATVATEAAARLDALGRTGDARLAGVLAALLRTRRRAWLAPRLAGPLGMPTARRVADLVGLHANLYEPYPDERRRAGLVRMSYAADLGALHAVAAAALVGRSDAPAEAAREQVEWSALHADEAGLLAETPWEPLRAGLHQALGDLTAQAGDRCWAEARRLYAEGRIGSVAEAVAATWRWRSGDAPRLVHMVGPAGSGKSSFARGLVGVDEIVSLDDLREARGSRADQGANGEVLHEALDRLDAALSRGGTVVWDATSLMPQQRSLVHGVARRRDALVTHAVVLVDEDELARRNSSRAHPVPDAVLAAQLRRFVPPYPGHAHRTWYVGAGGTVEDVDGTLEGEPHERPAKGAV
ncbi:MAG TPA: RNA ligase family protein, partial [Yinghuangia sp.]|nr:RNA ligase family protein [Yinghuangia sp.]